jgi:hypothetical protein
MKFQPIGVFINKMWRLRLRAIAGAVMGVALQTLVRAA